MSDGWGKDFDEDGNVIGEIPEDDSESFVLEHKYKISLLAVLVFALRAPSVAASAGVAGLVGAGVMSILVAIFGVYIYTWIR